METREQTPQGATTKSLPVLDPNTVCLPGHADVRDINPVDNHAENADPDMDNYPHGRGTHILVDHASMCKLRESGIAMPAPCNGPADGPPLYPIPHNLYRVFTEQEGAKDDNQRVEVESAQTSVIDPTLLAMTTPMAMLSPLPM